MHCKQRLAWHPITHFTLILVVGIICTRVRRSCMRLSARACVLSFVHSFVCLSVTWVRAYDRVPMEIFTSCRHDRMFILSLHCSSAVTCFSNYNASVLCVDSFLVGHGRKSDATGRLNDVSYRSTRLVTRNRKGMLFPS